MAKYIILPTDQDALKSSSSSFSNFATFFTSVHNYLRTWTAVVFCSTLVLAGVLIILEVNVIGSRNIQIQVQGADFLLATNASNYSTPSIVVRDGRFEARKGVGMPVSPVEVLKPDTILDHQFKCTPGVLDLANIHYHSEHRFYDMLKRIGPLPPPVFTGDHAKLCDERARVEERYRYCLPISGRKDEPYCNGADRMDLLVRQTPDMLCFGSMLHMLFVDVYEELKAAYASPFIAYGTLLGAIRNGSTIPFTEDADIGFMKLPNDKLAQLQQRLWTLGYHMFFHDIWRVCIAPTHPLASNLYDPKQKITRRYWGPYVDLYEMYQDQEDKQWVLQSAKNKRKIPDNKVRPFQHVRLNGLPFDTVADPIDFLVQEYGEDYMVPQAREEGWSWSWLWSWW